LTRQMKSSTMKLAPNELTRGKGKKSPGTREKGNSFLVKQISEQKTCRKYGSVYLTKSPVRGEGKLEWGYERPVLTAGETVQKAQSHGREYKLREGASTIAIAVATLFNM